MASSLIWLLLPILLMLVLPQGTSSQNASRHSIRDLMTAQIQSRYRPTPRGVLCSSCLISSMHRSFVHHNSENFSLCELNVGTREYPTKARDKIRMLHFGNDTTTMFEDFSLNLGSSSAVRKTYIGMARRVGDSIQIGMLSTEISAYLVQQYRVFTKKECWRVMWILWRKCKDKKVREPRRFTNNELKKIKAAMLSESLTALKGSLVHIHV